jgi:hypothetical protein
LISELAIFLSKDEAVALFPLNRNRDPMLPDLADEKNRFVEDWLGGQTANGDANDGSRNGDASDFLLMQMQDHHLTVW